MPIEKPTIIETMDSAFVLDQDANEWERAWLGYVYKRVKKKKLMDTLTIAAGETKYSQDLLYEPYRKISVFAKLENYGSGTGAEIRIQTSPNGADWFLVPSPSFSISLDGDAGDVFMWDDIEVEATYIRFRVVGNTLAPSGDYTIEVIAVS